MLKIDVPTLGDSASDFAKLFEIAAQVDVAKGDIYFCFSQCNSLRSNAMVFIGGLARRIELQNRKSLFDLNSIRSKELEIVLRENGFGENFQCRLSPKNLKNSIPYREDREMSMDSIMDYLNDFWLGRGWVQVSERLRCAITGKVWEIYNNAFEHSETLIGVFSYGQYFKVHNELILSMADFGQGISTKVRAFLSLKDRRAEKLTDASCLKWAFQRGNSTCTGDVARGLGLDLLKEFIRLNEGKMEVYSNKGYAIIDKNGERYKNRDFPFEGTIIHITLRCDESLYKFQDETDPIF